LPTPSLFKAITDKLEDDGIAVYFFSDVGPNPVTESVEAARDAMVEFKPDVIVSLGGGSAIELAYGVTHGASQSAISPLSTGGALILAAYGNFYNPSAEERSKVFVQLFVLALAMGAVMAVLGLFGFYGLFI